MSRPLKNATIVRCCCGGVESDRRSHHRPCLLLRRLSGGLPADRALPDAPTVRDADGGTTYVLYRKDRLQSSKGSALLKGYKLNEKSATNRVVATCCSSPISMTFDDTRHWIPVYRARFQGDAPPLEMRTCTKFRSESSDIPSDVPSYPTFPLKFMAKLVAARIAMLIRR
jgi:hypothetical protein